MNRPRKPLRTGDIYPAYILRDEYGMNAGNRPTIVVDPADVPEEFHALIPYVERWAISCDVTRGDYFDQQPEEDIAEFWETVLPYVEAINDWLDTQPDDVLSWSDSALHFLPFLKAHAEAVQHTAEELQEIERKQAEYLHKLQREAACEQAAEKFRLQDYQAVCKLLTPFEDELDRVLSAKLKYARKKQSSN